MKYSAFIFDFDYTLGDSTTGIVDSVNYAFDGMGFPARAAEKICQTVGMTMPEAFIYLTGNQDAELGQEFYRLFMQRANEVMTEGTVLYPDTEELLSDIKSMGYKTAIVTTKHHCRIDAILAKYDISRLVDVIVGINDVKCPKPDPEALYAAAQMLGAGIGYVLFTGDSVIDAQAAAAARADFFGVATGTTPKASLAAYPNIAVGESLADLKAMILRR